MTIFLSQAIGILFIAIGVSLALERRMLMGIFKELFQHRALTYIWGLITLVLSVFMVLKHNIWNGTAEIAVTVVGWYLFVESLVYVFLPQKYISVLFTWLQKKPVYYSLTTIFLILGGYFFSTGFSVFN